MPKFTFEVYTSVSDSIYLLKYGPWLQKCTPDPWVTEDIHEASFNKHSGCR